MCGSPLLRQNENMGSLVALLTLPRFSDWTECVWFVDDPSKSYRIQAGSTCRQLAVSLAAASQSVPVSPHPGICRPLSQSDLVKPP